MDRCPFVLSRDNTGYVLVNVKTVRAYQLSVSPISANLFGHGDILRVIKADEKRSRIITVIQSPETERAKLVSL